jgi:hypothetical protein
MSATFGASKIPSHRMKSGTQAMEGMARRAWSVGSRSRRAAPLAPDRAPTRMPAERPDGEAARHRCRVAAVWVHSSPGRGELGQRRPDAARGRHEPPSARSGAHRAIPGQAQDDGHRIRRTSAGPPRPGRPGRRRAAGWLSSRRGRRASRAGRAHRGGLTGPRWRSGGRSGRRRRRAHPCRPGSRPPAAGRGPAARIVSTWGWPMVEWVSSVRSELALDHGFCDLVTSPESLVSSAGWPARRRGPPRRP